jgi:hypothetical protein
MNVIAASKLGKSWLVMMMALCMAAAMDWLGFKTIGGDVLIIDNELHPETSAHRLPKLAAAMGIPLENIDDHVFIVNLRGRLKNIYQLRSYLKQFKPGQFRLIIIDAFYRMLPQGLDENDNGGMANLYNVLDQIAEELGASLVLIHHSSKGSQSSKAITDVGSGAGSMSRATDTHLVLRHHEEKGAVVLDAAVRSFKPIEPMYLRWCFPVWTPAPDLDPEKLRPEKPRKPKPATDKAAKKVWTIDTFVATFLKPDPQTKDAITIAAALEDQDLSERKAGQLLKAAVDGGKVHAWKSSNPAVGHRYATKPQPLIGGDK